MAKDDSIKDSIKKASKELDQVSSQLKPGFQKIINSLNEASPQVAKITADLRQSSKDTFQGALSANKLAGLSGLVDKFMSEGRAALDEKEWEKLNKNFATEIDGVTKNFNFTGFDIAQKEVNKTQNNIIKLEKNRRASYLNQTKEARESFREAKKAFEAGKISSQDFNKATEKLNEEKKKAEEFVEKKYDAAIKLETELLEERKTKLEGFTEDYKNALENATTFEGLTKFGDGVKELTGIDIIGFADDVTSKVNAIKDIAGSIGDMVGKLGSVDFSEVGNKIGGAFTAFGAGAKKLWVGMLSMGKQFIMIAKQFIIKGALLFKAGMLFIIKGVANMAKMMMKMAVKMIAAIVPFIAAATVFVAGLLMTAGSMLLTALPFIAVGALILIAGIALVKGFMALYENVGWFRGIIDTVVGFVSNIASSIFDVFRGLYDFIVGIFTGDFGMIMDGLNGIFGGLWDLIMTPFRAIGDFFRNVFGIDIGQILYDFAKKVLPGWILDWLGWGEGGENVPEQESRAIEPPPDAAAENAFSRAVQDEETQDLINTRRALSSEAKAEQRLYDKREKLITDYLNAGGKDASEADRVNFIDDTRKGGKDWLISDGVMDNYKAGSSEELKRSAQTNEKAADLIQKELDTRRDYVGRKDPYAGIDPEDISGFEDESGMDFGDRVKTARELRDEATKGMDAGMQPNVTTVQQNTTNVGGSSVNLSQSAQVRNHESSQRRAQGMPGDTTGHVPA